MPIVPNPIATSENVAKCLCHPLFMVSLGFWGLMDSRKCHPDCCCGACFRKPKPGERLIGYREEFRGERAEQDPEASWRIDSTKCPVHHASPPSEWRRPDETT